MYSLAPRVGTKTLHCLWWKVTNTQISQKTEENEWNVFTIISRALHLTASSTMSTVPNTWIYIFSGVRVPQSSVFCVVFYRSLFVLLSFSIWPLHCQYFYEWRLLVTPVVSSNFPCNCLLRLVLRNSLVTSIIQISNHRPFLVPSIYQKNRNSAHVCKTRYCFWILPQCCTLVVKQQ